MQQIKGILLLYSQTKGTKRKPLADNNITEEERCFRWF